MQGRRTEEVDGLNSRSGRMVTSTLSSSPRHAGLWCSDLHRWPQISWIGPGNEPRHAIELIPWVKSNSEKESERTKDAALINTTLDPPHISYFPPPVKAVPIPKKSGGVRILGIPTVADRVAQTAVKMWLEPRLDPIFRDDSYGYRPGSRRWRRSPSPDAAAGTTTGSLSSTSEACSTISIMAF